MNNKQQKRVDVICAALEDITVKITGISSIIQNIEDEAEKNGNEKAVDLLYEVREDVDRIANTTIYEIILQLEKVQTIL